MSIYQIHTDDIRLLPETTFEELKLSERNDLQRLLRKSIDVIAPSCLVIAEEFGEWADSRRRIDLLAIDPDANLVVVELKRVEDGGHMDLQAIRYAAMVSAMTFEKVLDVYARFLTSEGSEVEARESLLNFLGWDSPDEDRFAQDVRIVLASADFSKEITSAVLWLNDHGLDIRCVRLKPYRLNTEVLLDVQQIIPLPEAAEYQVQIREKVRQERVRQDGYRDFTKYDLFIDGSVLPRLSKRQLVYQVIKQLVKSGVTPETIDSSITSTRGPLFKVTEGELKAEEFLEALSSQYEKTGKRFDASRYFFAPGELFWLAGKTYALSNQWGGPAAINFVATLIQKFGGDRLSFGASEHV
ncbi:MAG: hypothetical protein JO360_03875 [Acidobacteria bacterium]|nr:hypothetical protein [Acidobacteriota bacterium]